MNSLQHPALQTMLQRGQLFRGQQHIVETNQQRASTGYPQLDQVLAGGLPYGQLHEVQLPGLFCGETALLRAPLQSAERANHPVFWFNPPAQPHVSGMGLSHARHTLLQGLEDDELTWAVSQVVSELSTGVVCIWHPNLPAQAVRQWQRRLHGELLLLVFTCHMNNEARAYHSRLRLQLEQGQLSWDVLKRPGGWPVYGLGERLQAW
ncbi:hypothetical protein [Aliidiomarina soli]|uniref:Translesion DNA synthesis-associated protein ImuA n=1 Tax=Aliidiomarina soli TaxID=1928574 RepID=A0A432WIJ6_9GAMM|nr:hypothetical protein [Aliidiomarina soli]RUO33593.1 hypothetical protein CWE14_03765 [Aliidiomarina soli]